MEDYYDGDPDESLSPEAELKLRIITAQMVINCKIPVDRALEMYNVTREDFENYKKGKI